MASVSKTARLSAKELALIDVVIEGAQKKGKRPEEFLFVLPDLGVSDFSPRDFSQLLKDSTVVDKTDFVVWDDRVTFEENNKQGNSILLSQKKIKALALAVAKISGTKNHTLQDLIAIRMIAQKKT
jgi:hypothetical protein